MKVGTKSVLWGAHQFAIHPWFVAAAWTRLYGFPWNYRLWIAFFLHDLGYWGKLNMDGPEGELHPVWAAYWMGRWFGLPWCDFCLYHSRFLSKQQGQPYSRLCVADKLAVAMEPWWFYLPRAIASGEIVEYMERAKARHHAGEGKYFTMNLSGDSRRAWFESVCDYLRHWAWEHKEGREDTWTPVMGGDK